MAHIGVVVAAVMIFLLTPVFAADPGITDTGLKIGMVNVQTGSASGLGKGMAAGIRAVFDEVNTKGGINGRKIDLVVGDDGYEPNKAVDETLRLIESEKIFAFIGFVGTPTGNAIKPVLAEYKVPGIGFFTGAMSLRSPVTREIINIRASYDDEADRFVGAFVDAGLRKIAVFYQDDSFGTAVLSGTGKALKKRGLEVAAKGTFQRNTVAVESGLAAVSAANPDALVLVGPYAPLAVFVQKARQSGLNVPMATVSFVGTDSFISAAGAAGEGVIISQVVPSPHDPSVKVVAECAALLKGEKLGYVNLEGCITAKAMVLALERAGKEVTRERLIEIFEGMKGVDLGGVSLTFGADDHQGSDSVFLTRVQGGKAAPVTGLK
ncbi:MAG: ABC transporter substrate-binding protein [Alphaproteobacteria bacterium]|uniref:ABC transporter substrate-binding protein n=1 Tax=Candidatus Nitrobium versatile TaxID=2884831 RepID=A0A953J3M1_9BACT|nr:ABC transporter substrate-binding protein [Candidatus Nitrobium versatile]